MLDRTGRSVAPDSRPGASGPTSPPRATPATPPSAPASSFTLPITRGSTPLGVRDDRDTVQLYLDEQAPSSIVGRRIRFSKGTFVTADDGEPIDSSAEFIALCPETLIGWIKFPPDGGPPESYL